MMTRNGHYSQTVTISHTQDSVWLPAHKCSGPRRRPKLVLRTSRLFSDTNERAIDEGRPKRAFPTLQILNNAHYTNYYARIGGN